MILSKPTLRITIEVFDEPDTLRRIETLDAAMVRVCKRAKLERVEEADYQRGRLSLIVRAWRVPRKLGVEHVRVKSAPC